MRPAFLYRKIILQFWSNDREAHVPIWTLGLTAGTGQRSIESVQVNELRLFPEGNIEQLDVISCRLQAEFGTECVTKPEVNEEI